MPNDATRTPPAVRPSAIANERFKRRWNRVVWGATALGVVFHGAVLLYTPDVEVDVVERQAIAPDQLLHLVNLADLNRPRVPAQIFIPAPALPTMEMLELELDLEPTIELPQFDEFAAMDRNLSPPLMTTRDEWLDYKHFAPYVVRPEIRNRDELKRFLERSYQRIYEYSGATGVVQVSFWIDEGGKVEKAEIAKSSGSRSLDRLALRLSRVLQFRPAMMAGRPIRILVHVPITFRAA